MLDVVVVVTVVTVSVTSSLILVPSLDSVTMVFDSVVTVVATVSDAASVSSWRQE